MMSEANSYKTDNQDMAPDNGQPADYDSDSRSLDDFVNMDLEANTSAAAQESDNPRVYFSQKTVPLKPSDQEEFSNALKDVTTNSGQPVAGDSRSADCTGTDLEASTSAETHESDSPHLSFSQKPDAPSDKEESSNAFEDDFRSGDGFVDVDLEANTSPVAQESDNPRVSFSQKLVPLKESDQEESSNAYITPQKSKKGSPKSPTSIYTSPTLDTVFSGDTTEMNSPQSPTSPTNQTVTIEHKVKSQGRGITQQLKKPLVLALGAFGLFATGGAAFFFTQFLQIPGLNAQIERLEAANMALEEQVDELEIQVDRLANETDRLEFEVDRLENVTDEYERQNELLAGNLTEFKNQNAILNASLQEYAALNAELNGTVSALEVQVDDLEKQNEAYAELTETLNGTVIELTTQVNDLEALNRELEGVNSELFMTVELLSEETELLSGLAASLNGTVGNLTDELALLASEIERLEELKTSLLSIVSFLNETTGSIDDSFESFASHLAKQTEAYRVLVLRTTENLYRQTTIDWDCAFRSRYSEQPFIVDEDVPIGSATYPEAIAYLEGRVFRTLCLDPRDFEAYLDANFVKEGSLPPVNATMNHLLGAVARYTLKALDYYFPEDDEAGVSSLVWAEANYQCQELPAESRYSWLSETT